VNALNDEEEAEKILGWLKKEINDTWERRAGIEPTYDAPAVPQMMQILKLLPRTNCRKCGQPTCTVFAVRAAEGITGPDDCPDLDGDKKARLEQYLGQFQFDM
jgi:ArsR family metal-binding transcriptional regulator